MAAAPPVLAHFRRLGSGVFASGFVDADGAALHAVFHSARTDPQAGRSAMESISERAAVLAACGETNSAGARDLWRLVDPRLALAGDSIPGAADRDHRRTGG